MEYSLRLRNRLTRARNEIFFNQTFIDAMPKRKWLISLNYTPLGEEDKNYNSMPKHIRKMIEETPIHD